MTLVVSDEILGYAEIQDIESQEDDGLGDLELARKCTGRCG